MQLWKSIRLPESAVFTLRATWALALAAVVICGGMLLVRSWSLASSSVQIVVHSIDADRGLLRLPEDTPVETVSFMKVHDRETILALVRSHRFSASDEWRRQLADAIYYESIAAGVDPLMIAAIIAKESSFKSQVVSSAGAVGLMQLRPWVAQDLALRGPVEWKGLTTLHTPQLNIRLGVQYYKELVDKYDGDARKALTAYNYGPTRLARFVRRGKYDGSEYADSILKLYDQLTTGRIDLVSKTE